MKTNQTTIPKAFHLVLVLEFLYLEFVSDLELRILNFFFSPPQAFLNYELRTKNSKLNKSMSFRAFRGLKLEKIGAVVDTFGAFWDTNGAVLDNFGVILAAFGLRNVTQNHIKNSVFSMKIGKSAEYIIIFKTY